jgi:hypothetical protein
VRAAAHLPLTSCVRAAAPRPAATPAPATQGMMNSDVMQQVQQAMSDPETQQQMLQLAEQMQEQVMNNPHLRALTEQLEGLDKEGGLSTLIEKFQSNPAMREMAEKMKGEMGALGELFEGKGLDGPEGLENAMKLGQEAFAKMVSDPEYMEKFQEAMTDLLPPGAMENMAEMFQGLMQDGGADPDQMAKLRQAMGADSDQAAKIRQAMGAGDWNKDEM